MYYATFGIRKEKLSIITIFLLVSEKKCKKNKAHKMMSPTRAGVEKVDKNK